MKKIEQETNSAAVLEIFHPHEDVICQHLNEGLGKDATEGVKASLGIKEIKPFGLTNPVSYINKLKDAALSKGNQSLLFKIFPDHLRDESKLKEVLSISDYVIVLRRNTLQSYISNKKAIKVGTYANVDTSDIKVDFDSNEFISWRRNIYSFFDSVCSICSEVGKEISSFNYEDLYFGEDSNMDFLYDSIMLDVKQPSKVKNILRKQDNNKTATGKVNNEKEMMSFLLDKGWQTMDSVIEADLVGE